MNWMELDDMSAVSAITEVLHRVSAKRSQGGHFPQVVNLVCLEFPKIPLDDQLNIGAEAMAAGVNVSFCTDDFDPRTLPTLGHVLSQSFTTSSQI
jgi:hypothetical protein